MINYRKNITIFKKNKNKIKKNIVLVGSGRWGRVLILEILKNFKNIKKIYVFTNYPNSLKKWINYKKYSNVIIITNFSELKKIKSNFSLIANKNKDHFKYCKKLLNFGYNVLVEKPFLLNLKKSKKLINLSKTKKLFLMVGLQFLFANYFYYIKKNIIKGNIITDFSIDWLDKKNEKRNNSIKIHDPSINYVEDVYYHAYSILYIFLGKGNIFFNKKISKLKKLQKLAFKYNNCDITINCSKNWYYRKRVLKLNLSNGKFFLINFSNDQNIKIKLNNKILKLPNEVCQKTLKYQLFSFFNLKSYDSKGTANDVRNLNNLFKSLIKLHKKSI